MPDQLAPGIPTPTPEIRTHSSTATSVRAPTSRPRCSPRSATARSTSSSTPRCPSVIREPLPLSLPEPLSETEALAALRDARGSQRGVHLADRPRLPRHDHAARDLAQRAREPGLVHGVHAVPARDQPGSARGAPELPDDGHRPHRHGPRQRVAARRGHCGGRGDGDAAPPQRRRRASVFFVDADAHPQTIDVVRTRAEPLGIEVVVGDPDAADVRSTVASACSCSTRAAVAGCATSRRSIERAHARARSCASPPTCWRSTLVTPPGEIGADAVVGTTQRFGVPLGFGGPHAAYLAVRDEHRRTLPGRLVGVSIDAEGRTAFRLALQTREQHIRREKATSNICTAQVLLAVIAGLYAAYHGADGLRAIARSRAPADGRSRGSRCVPVASRSCTSTSSTR